MKSLTWKSHPALERPAAAAFVTVFMMLVMWIVYYVMDRSTMMMFISGGILFISLSTFYFPTTFVVDENKVHIRYLFSAKERNLSAFRKCFPEAKGILLSPYYSPTRLENFRGYYLRYGRNNKAEVDAFVKELIESQEAQAVSKTSEVNPDAV